MTLKLFYGSVQICNRPACFFTNKASRMIETIIGALAANGSEVRDAVIQHAEMLHSWGNIRYEDCNRSILNEERRSAMGR